MAAIHHQEDENWRGTRRAAFRRSPCHLEPLTIATPARTKIIIIIIVGQHAVGTAAFKRPLLQCPLRD